jgi:hypothetical protein
MKSRGLAQRLRVRDAEGREDAGRRVRRVQGGRWREGEDGGDRLKRPRKLTLAASTNDVNSLLHDHDNFSLQRWKTRLVTSASERYDHGVMARPIEPTPVLEGEDADRLLEELEHVCTPEEAERRVAAARKLLAKVVMPNDDRAAAE